MSTAPAPDAAPKPAAPKQTRMTPPPAPIWPFIAALMGVVALAELAFIIVNVSALPVYLEYGLGLPGLVGIAMGAFYVAEAAGNPLMGGLSDRHGRRRMMVLGSLVSMFTCAATAGIAFLDSSLHVAGTKLTGAPLFGIVAAILALRVLDGMAAAMLWPAVYASVGDRIDEKRQGQALSSLNITYLIGIATGPYIGGFANDTLGAAFLREDARRYVPSFFLGAACFLISAVLAGLFAPRKAKTPLPEQQHHTEEAHDTTVGEIAVSAHPPVGWATVKRNLRKAPVLMLLGFLVFAGVGLLAPHAKTYCMDRFDLSETRFGQLLLWPALIIGALSPFLGKLTDYWGKPNSIHVGTGLCAASLWLLLFLQGETSVVVLGTLLGIGFVLAFPAYMAYINDMSDPNERGGLIGAVRMSQGIGACAGAVLASPLYTADPQHLALFCTTGALLTASFLLSLFYIRDQDKKPEEELTR